MKKIIDNRYELTTCTAIAASIGDTTRQKAIFFHDLQDEFRNGDGVIFGYDFDDLQSESDINNIDDYAISTDWEDIDTVEY